MPKIQYQTRPLGSNSFRLLFKNDCIDLFGFNISHVQSH